jgi:predicted nucleic acid binding AN1-type Zn finger protein
MEPTSTTPSIIAHTTQPEHEKAHRPVRIDQEDFNTLMALATAITVAIRIWSGNRSGRETRGRIDEVEKKQNRRKPRAKKEAEQQ